MTESRTIVIRLKGATIHRRHPESTARVGTISGLDVSLGDPRMIAIPPGQPVEVDRDEGLRLIARFGGEVIAEGDGEAKP